MAATRQNSLASFAFALRASMRCGARRETGRWGTMKQSIQPFFKPVLRCSGRYAPPCAVLPYITIADGHTPMLTENR
jgi:hypothetical protein